MITPEEIKQKAARQYLSFLQVWLRGEPFAPLVFPVGKLPTEDFAKLRTVVQQLQARAREARGYGYRLESRVRRMRSLSEQTLPVRVVIETPQDFLRLIEKEEEFAHFQQDVALIREQIPRLEDWMQSSSRKIIEQHGDWPGLLAICGYFLEHPRPGLYIRELPVNVHTKFVEQHMGILRELLDQLLPPKHVTPDALTFQQRFGLREEEPLIHIRFLDEQLSRRYGLPLSELCTPCSQLKRLDLRGQHCIITENKMTFLTLPPLPGTFAILGGGFKVSGLAPIPWLQECSIVYWGDLDAQGFQILAQLRAIFPHVVSLMMDEETLNTHRHFCVEGTPCTVKQLPCLTPEEHTLFSHLAEQNIRLEQEHISHAYVLQCINLLQAVSQPSGANV